MKYSYEWLQEHIEQKLPDADELKEKIIFHAFEVESVERVETDTVFDIAVLADRAGDCLSAYGMAREIAGLYGYTLKKTTHQLLPQEPVQFPIEIQHDASRRYLAIKIEGVSVSKSPAWLSRKLERIGQQSINNIVDAANFVMFDSGQPIHVFDAAKIDGGIVVRAAHRGETITTLSDEEKTLQENDIVIADYLGALAIAGVKGGKSAQVRADTTSILVEVANFDPTYVRKTSRRLGLITDASKRFENDFYPDGVYAAAMQIADVIVSVAGGVVVGATDVYKKPESTHTISCTPHAIASILGPAVTEKDIESVLSRYEFDYSKHNDTYTITVPLWRRDLAGVHDIAEEIGRAIGYERLSAQELPALFRSEPNPTDRAHTLARLWCIAQGYREVYTYTFRPAGEVAVIGGAKGKENLRANLSDGLKQSYELNRLNAPLFCTGTIKLFEIGAVFHVSGEEIRIATLDGGTVQETSIEEFLKQKQIDLHSVESLPELPSSVVPFAQWSLYPFIVRDMSVWVSGGATEKLNTLIERFAREHCLRHCVFDTFQKDGRTSVAYRFVFQAPDRTLTVEEVAATILPLQEAIAADPSFEIR